MSRLVFLEFQESLLKTNILVYFMSYNILYCLYTVLSLLVVVQGSIGLMVSNTYNIQNICDLPYGTILQSAVQRNAIACSGLCSRDVSCLSFIYNPLTSQCNTNNNEIPQAFSNCTMLVKYVSTNYTYACFLWIFIQMYVLGIMFMLNTKLNACLYEVFGNSYLIMLNSTPAEFHVRYARTLAFKMLVKIQCVMLCPEWQKWNRNIFIDMLILVYANNEDLFWEVFSACPNIKETRILKASVRT